MTTFPRANSSAHVQNHGNQSAEYAMTIITGTSWLFAASVVHSCICYADPPSDYRTRHSICHTKQMESDNASIVKDTQKVVETTNGKREVCAIFYSLLLTSKGVGPVL